MVDGTNVIWVEESLTTGMSMQKVELIALTKTLELGTSKKINIHMDNRYAFATANVHRDICQEDFSHQRKPTENLGPLTFPNEANNCEYLFTAQVIKREKIRWEIARQSKWLQEWICRSLY